MIYKNKHFRGTNGEGYELATIQGTMENAWSRHRLVLINSTNFDQYRVVFQVNVGPDYTGNVAVDDIIFSSECK